MTLQPARRGTVSDPEQIDRIELASIASMIQARAFDPERKPADTAATAIAALDPLARPLGTPMPPGTGGMAPEDRDRIGRFAWSLLDACGPLRVDAMGWDALDAESREDICRTAEKLWRAAAEAAAPDAPEGGTR